MSYLDLYGAGGLLVRARAVLKRESRTQSSPTTPSFSLQQATSIVLVGTGYGRRTVHSAGSTGRT